MKSKVNYTEKEDWSRAQVIAALHDRGITLVALAKTHGLADSSSFSTALSRCYPMAEKRIAAALNVHPMKLWPSRYNEDGTHINHRLPPYIFPTQQLLISKKVIQN